jgi:hypothetical protein
MILGETSETEFGYITVDFLPSISQLNVAVVQREIKESYETRPAAPPRSRKVIRLREFASASRLANLSDRTSHRSHLLQP